MAIGYDYTHSDINEDGVEYITFMTEPERLDAHGLRNGRAVHIELDHRRLETRPYIFTWVHGVPQDFMKLRKAVGVVLTDAGIPAFVKSLGIEVKA